MSQQQFASMAQQVGAAHAKADAAMRSASDVGAQHTRILAELNRMQAILTALQTQRTNEPNIQRIENIPGVRVPFDYAVEILIPAAFQSELTGTIQVSQEGPLVVVSRVATLRSAYEFQFKAPGSNTQARFFGRSYGRFRPVHSAWDLGDGVRVSQVGQPVTFPGTGAPHIISPSNESSFRSMEGDFVIKVVQGSTAYPRSNIPIPSTLWTKQINSPFELGALDFFERGDTVTFTVLPLHPSNPAYGNISAIGTGADPNYPFIDSQWDSVEGIQDAINASAGTLDPITRLPNAVLTLILSGFRIIQPAGAGPY